MQANTGIIDTSNDINCSAKDDMHASCETSQNEADSPSLNSNRDIPHKENSGYLGNEKSLDETDTGHLDKGWAWMVAIGASVCNFIVFGCLAKSSGIILNAVVERFQHPAAYSVCLFLSVGCTMLSSKYLGISPL